MNESEKSPGFMEYFVSCSSLNGELTVWKVEKQKMHKGKGIKLWRAGCVCSFFDNPVSREVGRFQVFVREDSSIDLSILIGLSRKGFLF